MKNLWASFFVTKKSGAVLKLCTGAEFGNLYYFVTVLPNLQTDKPIPTKMGKDWRKYPLL